MKKKKILLHSLLLYWLCKANRNKMQKKLCLWHEQLFLSIRDEQEWSSVNCHLPQIVIKGLHCLQRSSPLLVRTAHCSMCCICMVHVAVEVSERRKAKKCKALRMLKSVWRYLLMRDLIKMISFSCTMFVHSIPTHKGMFKLWNVGIDLKKKKVPVVS